MCAELKPAFVSATGSKALTVLSGRVTHEHYHHICVGVLWAGG
jgi:hypothetical protein